MKIINSLLLFILCSFVAIAQQRTFTPIANVENTPVISQGKTGTCWSFSTSSFLESEILRKTGKTIDLSEMYHVRNTYPVKAENYIMRQGKAQFSQGGLSHDVINSMRDFGLVPHSVYSGLSENEVKHNHTELENILSTLVNAYVKNQSGTLSTKWKSTIESVLDTYLGKKPSDFTYEGKKYTPQSFMEMTTLKAADYVTITSFENQKMYAPFVLNIPDNFSNGSMYNLPLKEFIQNIDHALENGYSLALDCDVSEETFSAKHGIAFIPADKADTEKGMQNCIDELSFFTAHRLNEFMNFNTTDDHLMHIVGSAKDQNGTVYYKVKNSWGGNSERVGNDGYIYMSTTYMELKAISVLLHKDGLTKKTRKALNL